VDARTDVTSDDPSPLDHVLEDDAARTLLLALEAVPRECRELWRMILGGLSYRDIGRSLGVAEGTLRVRAHRCRQKALEALAVSASSGGARGPSRQAR
jgi:RNA polymerase sigma factor (sigma-70 family)